MDDKKERLKPLSFYGHSLEDVIRAVMQVDPKPLWEEERRLREERKRKKDQKELFGE